MKIPFYFLLFLSLFSLTFQKVHAQNSISFQQTSAEDSLRKALEEFTKQDTGYVMTALRLSNEISERTPEEATFYAEKAVAAAQQLSNKGILAYALNIQGACYLTEDRYSEALRSFIDEIPLFQEVQNGIGLGNSYNNASLVFKHLGDYPQSLEYLIKSEHVFDSIDYPIGIARANNNLGSLFRLQNDLNQAEKHYQKAFQIHTEMENPRGKGIAQLNLGLLYGEKKEFDKGRVFLDSALTYFTENNIATSRVTTLIGLGEIFLEEAAVEEGQYAKLNAYEQAGQLFFTALAEVERLDMPQSKLSILNDLAKMKAEQGNVVQSRQFALQVKALADSINTPQVQSRAEETLSYVFQKAGQWEEAFTHFQQYKAWEDSLYNANTAALYKSHQVQMEIALKDREIEAQALQLTSLNEQVNLENKWKWALAVASFFLLIAGVLYYQKFRIRNKYSQQLEAQNSLISEQKEEIEKINQQLEEQIKLRKETDDTINYFATSIFEKNTVDEILWDVAQNCIARLGLIDCVIYLLDESRNMLIQKAAYGTKNPTEFEIQDPIEIPVGKGIVGTVAQSGEPELVNDTSQDPRYIVDDEARFSELAVPIKHRGKVIGVIDSEHPEKNFYTQYHQDALKTIAAICSSKIAQAQANDEARKAEKAQLEAQQIKAMDLMKSRFFANISHEFRTPLHLILGPLRVHGEQIPSNELGMMQRNAQRLLRLVNQLLDLSKLEMGQLQLEYQQADVFEFLKVIATSFASLAKAKPINYQVDISPRRFPARFDLDKMEKIVYNLLSNAIKFTPHGGTVTIHAALEPHHRLRISVSDTGLGIPPHLQDKIFDRFFQIDGSNTRAFEGTGIGLALIKELVDLHGGTITVDSETNQGTAFVVILPLEPAIGELVEDLSVALGYQAEEKIFFPEKELSMPVAEDEEQPLLLVVEDNPELRLYIRDNLRTKFNVREAVNGKEGLAMALEQIPDVVITDVMMPEMDGVELTHRLKNDERTSHIPIIMLTARDDAQTKRAGFQTGADQYLTKPFDPEELQVRVRGLITQRARLREKFGREVTLKPHEVTVNDYDAAFLERILRIVEENIGDSEFSIDQLQKEIGMSRMQLHRKLKALVGQSASEFIRHIRLQRAAQLLQNPGQQIADVAYEVGFSHLSYFAKCFKEKFGVAPSSYAENASSTS